MSLEWFNKWYHRGHYYPLLFEVNHICLTNRAWLSFKSFLVHMNLQNFSFVHDNANNFTIFWSTVNTNNSIDNIKKKGTNNPMPSLKNETINKLLLLESESESKMKWNGKLTDAPFGQNLGSSRQPSILLGPSHVFNRRLWHFLGCLSKFVWNFVIPLKKR